MHALELFIKGIIAGLIISAPVGPVNVLVVQRTIGEGFKTGVGAGIGAALGDTVYGGIAGFSITFVIGFIIHEEFWIQMGGGFLLILVGIWYYHKQPPKFQKNNDRKPKASDLTATFLLTLTNPTTVLSFLLVLTVLGLGGRHPSPIGLMLVAGIFAGAMLWWTVLSMTVNRFRDRFNDRAMSWLNRIGGVAIGGFGIIMMLLSLGHRPHH
jgi:threonine/homoserine/homoserine lactone efflux protein